MSALSIIENLEPKFRELAKTHDAVVFAQECLFAKQLLDSNSYLTNIAMQNPKSLEAAILNIASIGLSLNPATKQAYLVPMDGRVVLMPSYMGLCHLAQETGSVRYVQAELVFSTDQFEYQGVGLRPVHKFNPFSKERGEIVGAYSIAKTSDDDYLVTMMPIDDIFSIRNRSKAWKAYQAKKVSCPWVTDEKAMILKTVIKSASKFWPKSERTYRLDSAIHVANESEGIDFEEEKEQPNEDAHRVDYEKKRTLVEEIKGMLTVVAKGMSNEEKAKLLMSTCKVKKFDDLNHKTIQELVATSDTLVEMMKAISQRK
jgi:recombination protein RecT